MSKRNSGWVRRQTAALLSATLVLSPLMAVPAMAVETDGTTVEQGQDATTDGQSGGVATLSDPTPNTTGVAAVSDADGKAVGTYDSLSEAISNVPDNGTISLLDDVTGPGVVVGESKTFTIDLGGYTYTVTNPTVGSAGTETNGFQLLQGNTITFKNGTITASTASAKILIQNYSNLTLERVHLVGLGTTQYVLSNNCGEVHIGEGTSITAAEGQVAFDVCRFSSYPSVHVVVDEGAGKIVGEIEITDGGSGTGDFRLTINGGDLSDAHLSVETTKESAAIEKDASVSLPAPAGYQWVDGELAEESGPTIDAVASITDADGNPMYFSTLSGAFAKAAAGQTIALLKNVAESVTIPEGAEVTLDLAGHTLTNTAGQHTITNNGTLTIMDSMGGGTVDNVSHGKAALFNDVSGVATLDGGTFNRSQETGSDASTSGGNSFYTLQNYGDMTINKGVTVRQGSSAEGGKFSSLIENGWYDGNKNTTRQDATMTINGGSFVGGLNTIKNDDWGVLTINDGSFTNTAQAAVLNWNKTAINGGTFQSDQYAVLNGYLNDSMDTGVLAITGGTFAGGEGYEPVAQMGGSASVGSVSISGGSFWASPDEDYIVPGSGLTKNDDDTYGVHKHVAQLVEAVAPTCTEDGHEAYYVCPTCHELFSDAEMTKPITIEEVTIPKTNHKNVTYTKATDPTETTDGNYEYWYCEDCGKYFSDQALTHETTLAALTRPALGREPVETYTVTFDYGTGAPSTTVTVADGEAVPRPADPTYEGWTFAGWFTDDGTFKDAYDFSAPVTGDLTLYAGWYKNGDDTTVAKPGSPATGDDAGDKADKGTDVLAKTGDATSAAAPLAAAALGATALAGAVVARRRRE